MNFKIVKIHGMAAYGIRKIYDDRPCLKESTYRQQKEYLKKQCLVYFNDFSGSMRALGNEADDIIYDVEVMQKKWAQEHGVRYSQDNWQIEILLAQIAYLKPDVLYFQDIFSLPHNIRKELKQRYPFLKLVTIFKGFPGYAQHLKDADIIFCGMGSIADEYRKVGIKTHIMYHIFDPAMLAELKKEEENRQENLKYDFTFAGSSGYGYGASHHSRYWTLIELFKRTRIEGWIFEPVKAQKGENKKVKKYPAKYTPMKPLVTMFPSRCHVPLYGLELLRLLRRSRVTFNMHTDSILGYVGNMRMFEATGAGTCLLTEKGKNMTDLFEEDKEIVTYSSVDECIEKMNYLLENETIREQIAAAGQRRTLREHSIEKQCQKIDVEIQALLK